jgi:hypothetical protein
LGTGCLKNREIEALDAHSLEAALLSTGLGIWDKDLGGLYSMKYWSFGCLMGFLLAGLFTRSMGLLGIVFVM